VVPVLLLPAAAIALWFRNKPLMACTKALEIRSRSSYVPNITTGVLIAVIQRCAPECAVSDARLEMPIWMK